MTLLLISKRNKEGKKSKKGGKEDGEKEKGRRKKKEEKIRKTPYIPTYFTFIGNLGLCDSVQLICVL